MITVTIPSTKPLTEEQYDAIIENNEFITVEVWETKFDGENVICTYTDFWDEYNPEGVASMNYYIETVAKRMLNS